MYPKMGRGISQALCAIATRPTAFDAQQASWRKGPGEGHYKRPLPGERETFGESSAPRSVLAGPKHGQNEIRKTKPGGNGISKGSAPGFQ